VPALGEELVRLSQGDPLLLRLYLDALLTAPAAHQLAWITLSDLPRLPPGLEAWFTRWWQQLRHGWAGDAELETATGALFDVLATALAPLPRADVDWLMARIIAAPPETVAAACAPCARCSPATPTTDSC
jgi:hypothetical protein